MLRAIILLLTLSILVLAGHGASAQKKTPPTPEAIANEMEAMLPRQPDDPPFPPSELHSALTANTTWLNLARPLEPKDLAGRIVLVNFCATSSINCIQSIPDLHQLEQEFGSALTIISVYAAKFDNEKDEATLRQAVLRHGLTHPIIHDADLKISAAFGIRGWPSFMLIDPKGKVYRAYFGEGHRAALEKDIRKLSEDYFKSLVKTLLPLAPEKDKNPVAILRFPGKLEAIPDLDGKPALAIADSGNHRILITNLSGSILRTYGTGSPGSNDGDANTAQFNTPHGMTYQDGMLYVADTGNHMLRRIDTRSGEVSTLAGTGRKGFMGIALLGAPAHNTALASPYDIAFSPDRQQLIIAMTGSHQLWRYDLQQQELNVAAGSGMEGMTDGVFPQNALAQPASIAISGETVYVVDSKSNALRAMSGKRPALTTLIGKGLFESGYTEGDREKARMQFPLGVLADGADIYIADTYNHAIRRYDTASATLTHYAGTGTRGTANGDKTAAQFNEPGDIARIGDTLYVADTGNHRIRTINLKNNKAGDLPILPPDTEEAPAFSDVLPNMHPLPYSQVKPGESITLMLELQKGWRINRDAPSYLALFDGDGTLLRSFRQHELRKGSVTMAGGIPTPSARLQATLYYCEDRKDALCFVKSFDGMLEASADATGSTLTLPVY